MGDFLSLLGAAFDSFFGFIFFSIAYYEMYRGRYFKGAFRSVKTVTHIIILLVGLFLLGPGLYAACKQIVLDYCKCFTIIIQFPKQEGYMLILDQPPKLRRLSAVWMFRSKGSSRRQGRSGYLISSFFYTEI